MAFIAVGARRWHHFLTEFRMRHLARYGYLLFRIGIRTIVESVRSCHQAPPVTTRLSAAPATNIAMTLPKIVPTRVSREFAPCDPHLFGRLARASIASADRRVPRRGFTEALAKQPEIYSSAKQCTVVLPGAPASPGRLGHRRRFRIITNFGLMEMGRWACRYCWNEIKKL